MPFDRPVPALLLLLLVAPALAPAHAQRTDRPPSSRARELPAPPSRERPVEVTVRPAPPRELPSSEAWRTMIARDRRIEFTPRTAVDARGALDAPDLSSERRAVAWIALGSAGSTGDDLRLEDIARNGPMLERQAAVLALGEKRTGFEPLLLELAGSSGPPAADAPGAVPPEVGECALLALLRSDRASSRKRVADIAHDRAHPLAHAAADLLVFSVDPGNSTPTRAAALLLELRWEAARHFGLVDGQSWSVLRVRELSQDPAFLREVVLRAAANLDRAGIKDHLLAELMTGAGPGRLRAAVSAMPLELTDLVDSGLWSPKDAGEWKVILDQIDELGLEALTTDLLEYAAQVEGLRYRSIALLARAPRVHLEGRLDVDLAQLGREDRLWVLEAAAASDDPGLTKRIEELRADPAEETRSAALVTLARLGSRKAQTELLEVLDDGDHAEHAALVANLCRTIRDPLVAVLLEEHLNEAEGDEAVEIATALSLGGHLTERMYVRDRLAGDPAPTGENAVRLVRALRRQATGEDLGVFRQLFPRESELELNVELALALTELGDASILPLLRETLWRGTWDQSLLAGCLLSEIAGIHSLRGELQRPPVEATSIDVRRVGYAVGEWGGLFQVESLARELRYSSGHPALQGALLGFLSARTH